MEKRLMPLLLALAAMVMGGAGCSDYATSSDVSDLSNQIEDLEDSE